MKRPLPIHLCGQRVYVYKNLNDDCLSIMQREDVLGHAVSIILSNVEFRVRKGTRERAIAENNRNVHAFAIGRLEYCSSELWLPFDKGVLVGYNYCHHGYFYRKETGEPVYAAEQLVVNYFHTLAFGVS